MLSPLNKNISTNVQGKIPMKRVCQQKYICSKLVGNQFGAEMHFHTNQQKKNAKVCNLSYTLNYHRVKISRIM